MTGLWWILGAERTLVFLSSDQLLLDQGKGAQRPFNSKRFLNLSNVNSIKQKKMSLNRENSKDIKDIKNNRMAYSEYQDLTPIDHIENSEGCIASLFHNKKIRNITVGWPYSAGKK